MALACLFLSSKLNDTPKKARDILLASYALRFPELVKGDSESSKTGEVSSAETNGEGAGTKRKEPSSDSNPFPPFRGSVTDSDIDASVLETDRKRLMALEKLLLESICFNFELRAQTALRLVIKVGRMWQLPKALCHAAWRVAADLHRTTAPLQYPSKVIAVASYYAVALLMEPPPSQLDGSVSASYPLDPQDAVQDQTRAAAREVIAKLAKAGRPDSSTSTSGSGSGVGSCEEVLGIHIEDVEGTLPCPSCSLASTLGFSLTKYSQRQCTSYSISIWLRQVHYHHSMASNTADAKSPLTISLPLPSDSSTGRSAHPPRSLVYPPS